MFLFWWQTCSTLQGSITVHNTWDTKTFWMRGHNCKSDFLPKTGLSGWRKARLSPCLWVCRPAQCCCDSKHPHKSCFSFLRLLGHNVTFECWSHILDNSQYLLCHRQSLGAVWLVSERSYPCNFSRKKLGAANLSRQNTGPFPFPSGLLTAGASGDVDFHTIFFLYLLKILKNSRCLYTIFNSTKSLCKVEEHFPVVLKD